MTKNLMPSIVLSCICIAVAILLAGINMITGPIIADRQNAAANAALLEVYPDGSFSADCKIEDLSPYTLPSEITDVYKENNGGYVFGAKVVGYKPDMIIMCGVDPSGKITGTKVISNNETPSIANKVFELTDSQGYYVGADINTIPDLVASVTPAYTAGGYDTAIKAALNAFVVMNGGEVDLRDPAQILQDNCNAALGTEGKTFTKWFATEVIVGVDTVYETDGGRVYVIGETFVGIKADGTVATTDVADDIKTIATNANTIIAGSTITEITELPAGIKADITKISVTSTGNYVIEVLGYGYKYESNVEFAGIEAGEIQIKISIDADGKIIDVVTLSHQESKGYGDYCATEDYYEQYKGHVNGDIVITVPSPDFHEDQIPTDCTDIGAISSSTYTTTAYQVAVKAAFAAFELLTNNEGGELQ